MSRRGGTERMTSLLANALSEQHNVWIVSLTFKNDELFFKLKESIKHIVLPNKNKKFQLLYKIDKIRKIIKNDDIEVLINVDIGTCIFGIPATWGKNCKVITWEHSNYFNNWNSKKFAYFRYFAAKKSDALVVLTEKDKKNYCMHIKPKKPIVVIPNPIEKHDYSYDLLSKTILSAGLLVPVKRFELVIVIAKKILKKYPDWKWIICGEGGEREKLEELIKEANLENQVQLIGTVENMNEKYQNSAIFAMTSQMEGLPMVLLEAKSWGLPIISFDIMTGPSDIIRDGINGFLIKNDDISLFSEKLEELIKSKQCRNQFSKNSQLDMENFDFNNILDKWNKLFFMREI